MTEETRQNAINHIRTALDVDDWAKDAAIEALQAYQTEDRQPGKTIRKTRRRRTAEKETR